MNIPDNSFITLVEYTDPNVARVTWQSLDSDDNSVVLYEDETEKKRIAEIVKQQYELLKDEAADDADHEARAVAMRALCANRPS